MQTSSNKDKRKFSSHTPSLKILLKKDTKVKEIEIKRKVEWNGVKWWQREFVNGEIQTSTDQIKYKNNSNNSSNYNDFRDLRKMLCNY